MTLKKEDWEIYAILREYDGKKKAEEYKQRCFKRYKKYGLLLKNENNGYNFIKAFGDYFLFLVSFLIPKKKKLTIKSKYHFSILRMTVRGKNSPPGLIFTKSTMGRGFIIE